MKKKKDSKKIIMNVRKVNVIYSEEGNNCWGRARVGGGGASMLLAIPCLFLRIELCG